jgi:hypothetical protein
MSVKDTNTCYDGIVTKLSRLTVCNQFEILNPRWHDRQVLLADYKISTHNAITFPKANSMPGEYYISGISAKKYPTQPMKTKNGAIMTMRVVSIDALEPLERI